LTPAISTAGMALPLVVSTDVVTSRSSKAAAIVTHTHLSGCVLQHGTQQDIAAGSKVFR
jgi:hypothetical protein